MRKMIQLLSFAIVITIIGLAVFMPLNKVNADDGECLTKMSQETARYVESMKIPLKGADYEFYGSKDEQVYLLNSEETLKLGSKKSIKNTVAVINHKDANGRVSFYVIEQEITPDKITFLLKQDSKVLQTQPVKLLFPRASARLSKKEPPPCQQSDCDAINNDTKAQIQALLVDANRTCMTQHTCLPLCNCFAGKLAVAPTLIDVPPNSRRCEIKYLSSANLLFTVEVGPLLEQAFYTAVKKEIARYTF